jgi:twitching motility protein PilT
MSEINGYLQQMVSNAATELRLEPNEIPYVTTANGNVNIAATKILGGQISMLVFPMIPAEARNNLSRNDQVDFPYEANGENFNVHIRKSPVGLNVCIAPVSANGGTNTNQTTTFSQPVQQDYQPIETPPVAQSYQPIETPPVAQSYQPIETTPVVTPVYQPIESPALPEISQPQVLQQPHQSNESSFNQPLINSQSNSISQNISVEKEPTFVPATANQPARKRMDALFQKMCEIGASDLHMSVTMPPMIRKDGKMMQLPSDESTLTPSSMKDLLTSIMPDKNQEEFDRRHDTDFAYEITGLARFRANIFMDRKGMGGVFRVIPSEILTAEKLGLSKAILDLCNLSKGLVVVTGPTGSGKSTTLCAMVDHINKEREDHIITIEDPIEFVHDNKKCLINQREVHNHTDSFKDALRAALREDPDIVLVGEMRDLETIAIAIETAETGHLVFGTLHTSTAASTIDRIIDQFPADRQQQIRIMLSESLRGVIAQTLLPKKGGGRIAALEVLIVTPAISNLIREGKTFQIPSAMQTGKQMGMVMLNDALFDLVQKGLVEPKDAYVKAVDKTGFEMILTRNGIKM